MSKGMAIEPDRLFVGCKECGGMFNIKAVAQCPKCRPIPKAEPEQPPKAQEGEAGARGLGDGGYRCTACDTPIFGAMIGDGDGTGKRFAHPECWYRARLKEAEAKVESLEVQLKGSEERARMLLEAKNHWADRARAAEAGAAVPAREALAALSEVRIMANECIEAVGVEATISASWVRAMMDETLALLGAGGDRGVGGEG